MAHAQKPDFVFRRNRLVHLNRWGRQFSRLLAAKVCASAWVMLDTSRSEVAWEYWLPTPFASFSSTSPPVRHRVPPGTERALLLKWTASLHSHVTKIRNCVYDYEISFSRDVKVWLFVKHRKRLLCGRYAHTPSSFRVASGLLRALWLPPALSDLHVDTHALSMLPSEKPEHLHGLSSTPYYLNTKDSSSFKIWILVFINICDFKTKSFPVPINTVQTGRQHN